MGIEQAPGWVMKRRNRGGRVKTSGATRDKRQVICIYEDELRDLGVIARYWDVNQGQLCWGVVHDWLQRQRVVSSELGDMRASLRAGLELALRDVELGPWLRSQISSNPHGEE